MRTRTRRRGVKRGTVHLPIAGLLALSLFFGAACVSPPDKPIHLIKKKPGDREEALEKYTREKEKSGNYTWVQKPLEEALVAGPREEKKTADYLMNFDNIVVPDFIEAMMSGVFKRNYFMSETVKNLQKKFTVKMTEDLKQERAFDVFLKILDMHNVSVDQRQNTYFFDTQKAARLTLKGPIVYGRQLPENLSLAEGDEVTVLVPFYNIAPDTLKPILSARLPSRTLIISLKEPSILVLNGNAGDMRYALSFIELLDRAQFKEKSIVLITPRYWDIYDFQKKLEDLLAAEGILLKTAEASGGLVFIPLERLNSLMIISAFQEWVERCLYWLDKLDVPEAVGEARNVYAYKLRNVEVESVIEVLKEYSKESIVSPSSREGTKAAAKTGTPKGNESAAIIPVKETNTVVIVAAPVEYRKYLDIIKRIDVPRNQVFVEVIIGEIILDTDTQLGLEFWIDKYLYRTSFGTKGGLGVYKGVTEQGNAVIPPGSNAFLKGAFSGTQFEILLNALVSHSKINIISTPKLTVAENAEAEIKVGSDVPVISSESGVYAGGATSQTTAQSYFPYRSIQYIETGIILKVKAAILSGNKISLELTQEISEAQENKLSAISSPEILKRTVKTTMIVQEGEIAFIGGLIQDKRSGAHSGIPVLSKIPLLGNLFKKSSKRLRKTELVVFINSRTIRKSSEMKEIVEGVKKIISNSINLENEK